MANTYGYVRVSTEEQTIENQKLELSERYNIDRWFEDQGVSGSVKGEDRKGLSELLIVAHTGDTVITTAIDRLGRDTVDVLNTVEKIKAKGATVVTKREGFDLSTPTGKAMLTIMSALAELEKANIKERQMAGINRARAEGKHLGRKQTVDHSKIKEWRQENNKSIKETSEHFGISIATVKRACAR